MLYFIIIYYNLPNEAADEGSCGAGGVPCIGGGGGGGPGDGRSGAGGTSGRSGGGGGGNTSGIGGDGNDTSCRVEQCCAMLPVGGAVCRLSPDATPGEKVTFRSRTPNTSKGDRVGASSSSEVVVNDRGVCSDGFGATTGGVRGVAGWRGRTWAYMGGVGWTGEGMGEEG